MHSRFQCHCWEYERTAIHVDLFNGLEKQTVIAPDGTDITEIVERAVAWLTENSF